MISNRLNSVEQRFKTSPELIKVPHDLETLTTNIATFGSQMQDLVTTMGQLKEANTRLAETTKGVQSNVTSLQVRIPKSLSTKQKSGSTSGNFPKYYSALNIWNKVIPLYI